MLETIREYALERLRTADNEANRPGPPSGALPPARRAGVRGAVFDGLARNDRRAGSELDNLRAAVDWGGGTDAERELELVGALAWFWINQTTIGEAEERLTAALGRTGTPTAARTAGAALRRADRPRTGKRRAGVPLFEEALAAWRELGDSENMSNALDGLGGAHSQSGHEDLAQQYFEESLDLRQKLGHPELVTARSDHLPADHQPRRYRSGRPDRPGHLSARCGRPVLGRANWPGSALVASCALIRDEYAIAERRYARAAMFAWEHGDRRECATQMQGLAIAVSGRGDCERALRICGATLAERARRWFEWASPPGCSF